MLKLFLFLYFLKLIEAQSIDAVPSVAKCANFSPIKYENFDELLIGKWNLLRMYGVPAVSEKEKDTCVCSFSKKTEKEHQISVQILDTRFHGGITNLSATAIRIKNGAVDLSLDKEVEVAGMKITIRLHAVLQLLLLENNELALVSGCTDNVMRPGEFFQTIQILGRNTIAPPSSFMEKVEPIIESYGFNITFNEISHKDCQY